MASSGDLDHVAGPELVLAPAGRRDEDRGAEPDREVALGGDDEPAGAEADAGRDDGRRGRRVGSITAIMMADPVDARGVRAGPVGHVPDDAVSERAGAPRA